MHVTRVKQSKPLLKAKPSNNFYCEAIAVGNSLKYPFSNTLPGSVKILPTHPEGQSIMPLSSGSRL